NLFFSEGLLKCETHVNASLHQFDVFLVNWDLRICLRSQHFPLRCHMFVSEENSEQYCNDQCINCECEPDAMPCLVSIWLCVIVINNPPTYFASKESSYSICHHHK